MLDEDELIAAMDKERHRGRLWNIHQVAQGTHHVANDGDSCLCEDARRLNPDALIPSEA